MKFCPECGTKLTAGTAKFCINCGENLFDTKPLDEPIVQARKPRNNNEEITAHDTTTTTTTTSSPTYSLGTKLEETVEQILKGEGYSTERRKKLVGKSNIEHEIDILAKKGNNNNSNNKNLAVECKNYKDRKIGTEEIRNFQSKIKDLPFITDKLFVTNVQFSTDAKTYANYNEIELWDGNELEHMHYLLNIGRLNSEQEIVLNFSLPINGSYEQAIRRLVVNPYAVKVSAKLVLNPYFVFEYELDIRKGFLGREKIHDYGTHVVDALSGEILYVTDIVESRFPINRFFSKDNKRNKDSEETLKDMEKNQIILDLKTIKTHPSYKIKNRPVDYKIDLLKDRVPIDAAERMILDEIAEEKKANENDIKVKKEYLVYVPKWEINFNSSSYNKIYRREILAASNTVLVDEIAYCPKDFFANIRGNKKMTYAICEVCGNAYCKSHIEKLKNSYYCKDHR